MFNAISQLQNKLEESTDTTVGCTRMREAHLIPYLPPPLLTPLDSDFHLQPLPLPIQSAPIQEDMRLPFILTRLKGTLRAVALGPTTHVHAAPQPAERVASAPETKFIRIAMNVSIHEAEVTIMKMHIQSVLAPTRKAHGTTVKNPSAIQRPEGASARMATTCSQLRQEEKGSDRAVPDSAQLLDRRLCIQLGSKVAIAMILPIRASRQMKRKDLEGDERTYAARI